MSQTHYHGVPLEDVIQQSDCIVIAAKADPAITRIPIDVTPLSHKMLGKSYPPFIEITYHFRVTGILFTGKAVEQGQLIDVRPANQSTELTIHKAYYVDGDDESPAYLSYDSGIDLDAADELILFLNTADSVTFSFTVEGAYESVARREDIAQRITTLME